MQCEVHAKTILTLAQNEIQNRTARISHARPRRRARAESITSRRTVQRLVEGLADPDVRAAPNLGRPCYQVRPEVKPSLRGILGLAAGNACHLLLGRRDQQGLTQQFLWHVARAEAKEVSGRKMSATRRGCLLDMQPGISKELPMLGRARGEWRGSVSADLQTWMSPRRARACGARCAVASKRAPAHLGAASDGEAEVIERDGVRHLPYEAADHGR